MSKRARFAVEDKAFDYLKQEGRGNKSANVNSFLLEEKRRLRNKPGMEKRYAEPMQAALSIVFNL